MLGIDRAQVDPSNTEQLRAWDGDEGAYWAAHAELFERSTGGYDAHLFGAAAIDEGSRVLDIGCGTGSTTRAAARAAARGSVLGADLSSRMVAVARESAAREGLGNVRFEQVDAQIHDFGEGSFDVAISRTGTMFFGDLAAGFANVRRTLRPGGRLVQLVWQSLPANEWIAEIGAALAAGRDLPLPPADAQGPFALSNPDRVRDLLRAAGFGEPRIDAVAEPMYFGPAADRSYPFVLGQTEWMLEGLDEDGRSRAKEALRVSIAAHERADGVFYDSAMWLVVADR
jgi:SAM-dependent methyltransferase